MMESLSKGTWDNCDVRKFIFDISKCIWKFVFRILNNIVNVLIFTGSNLCGFVISNIFVECNIHRFTKLTMRLKIYTCVLLCMARILRKFLTVKLAHKKIYTYSVLKNKYEVHVILIFLKIFLNTWFSLSCSFFLLHDILNLMNA